MLNKELLLQPTQAEPGVDELVIGLWPEEDSEWFNIAITYKDGYTEYDNDIFVEQYESVTKVYRRNFPIVAIRISINTQTVFNGDEVKNALESCFEKTNDCYSSVEASVPKKHLGKLELYLTLSY